MIDLRSDTVTTPDDQMREAARDAPVGDDVYGEDPTINELEGRFADLVGFENALFVPTGTMGNQVAVRTHTDRGQEVLVERESHVYKWELGGLAQLSGLQVRTLDGDDRGVVIPEQIHAGYVEEDAHRPGTGLLTLENTHNSKGGTALAPSVIDAAADAAHDRGIPVHLDGARLPNAAVAHDVSLDRLTASVDSVMCCLSKGLGAPVGSMLAGDASFIEAARRNRKLFGGGMRQAGIVAAPGLRALENIDRLDTDHQNAQLLATQLGSLPGLSVQPPETNIVLVDTNGTDLTAEQFLDRCADAGVQGTRFGEYTARFCTHLDVSEADIRAATDRIADAY